MSVKTKKIPAFGTRKIARKPLTKKGNETMKYETTIGQIKTPKTVKEFRENLKNYFFTAGEDYLCVFTKNGGARDIPINNISSLEDLYELTGTGFDGDGSTPCIVPLIDYEQEKIMDVGKKTGYRSFFGEDYKVYTKEQSLSAQHKVEDPKWFGLDNKILREFYVKVLGDFSGYEVVDVSKELFPTTTN